MKKSIKLIKTIFMVVILFICIGILSSDNGLQEVYALDTSSGYLVGDVDNNGYIDYEDVTQILRYVNGKSSVWDGATGTELERLNYVGDADGENGIEAKDATAIERYIKRNSSKWDSNIF